MTCGPIPHLGKRASARAEKVHTAAEAAARESAVKLGVVPGGVVAMEVVNPTAADVREIVARLAAAPNPAPCTVEKILEGGVKAPERTSG